MHLYCKNLLSKILITKYFKMECTKIILYFFLPKYKHKMHLLLIIKKARSNQSLLLTDSIYCIFICLHFYFFIFLHFLFYFYSTQLCIFLYCNDDTTFICIHTTYSSSIHNNYILKFHQLQNLTLHIFSTFKTIAMCNR